MQDTFKNKSGKGWVYEFLKKLEALPESERPWAVTQLCLSNLSEDLRTVVWQMAKYDYFDAHTIATACPELAEQSESLYLQIQELPFVEEFPRRGHNIHELTRAQLLSHA
jgi:hypothetical protein